MIDNSDKIIFEKICSHCCLKGKKVLEIGCGTGRISTLIATAGCSLIAIDPDEKVIAEAKLIPGIDFRVGSGEALSFPDNHFDLVLFTLSLHHQNSLKALAEASRVLKPDGKILVIEPVASGTVNRVFAFLKNEDAELSNTRRALDKCGLALIASEEFTADWTFNDKDDLLRSLFQFYDKPFDSGLAAEVIAFLGDRDLATPMILPDNMIILSLRRSLP